MHLRLHLFRWMEVEILDWVLTRVWLDPFMHTTKNRYLLFERSRGKAASTVPRWNADAAHIWGRNTSVRTVGLWCSISRHRCCAAIEYWRCKRIGCPFRPAVIRLVAFVAALIAEGLFVGPGEVSVPGEEVTLRLVNVWIEGFEKLNCILCRELKEFG